MSDFSLKHLLVSTTYFTCESISSMWFLHEMRKLTKKSEAVKPSLGNSICDLRPWSNFVLLLHLNRGWIIPKLALPNLTQATNISLQS
jgi:hypothetical protein